MIKGARSSAVVALLVIVAGLAVAACGSSSTSSSSASASSSGAATSTSTTGTSTTAGRGGGIFASLTATQRSCLKSKGVTLPTGGGHFGGGRFGGGTGTFTRPTGTPPGGTSTTGGGFGPGGPGGPGGAGGGFRGAGGANASKFATAFKACGVTFAGHFGGGFGGGAGGHVSATALKTFVACVDKHGYKLTDVNTSGKGSALPKSLETNKKFLAAAKDCEQDLRPTAASGTTTTSSS